MKIKAGRYTLALTMIACGVLMIMSIFYGRSAFGDLWTYSPGILILFGLEIIVLNLIFGARENYKVELSAGNIIVAIFVIVVFMIWNSGIDFYRPLHHYFRW